MFPVRYFCLRYFPTRYFCKVGATPGAVEWLPLTRMALTGMGA